VYEGLSPCKRDLAAGYVSAEIFADLRSCHLEILVFPAFDSSVTCRVMHEHDTKKCMQHTFIILKNEIEEDLRKNDQA